MTGVVAFDTVGATDVEAVLVGDVDEVPLVAGAVEAVLVVGVETA